MFFDFASSAGLTSIAPFLELGCLEGMASRRVLSSELTPTRSQSSGPELLIEELLSLWVKTRSPEVGRLLEQASAGACPPEDLPTKKKERAEQLAALVSSTTPASRGSLIAAFEGFARDASGALVWPAVEAWADVAPDPRVARMALRLLVSLEHQLTAKLWRRLVVCLETHGDSGVAAEAQPYLKTLREKRGGRVERLENVLKRLETPSSLAVEPSKLAEFQRRLPSFANSARPETDDEMLAAIVAAPDDDAPRAVWADALSERQSPLGEFITLQLASAKRKPTKEERARTSFLLANHRATILGPYDGLVKRTGLVFERGFPVEVVALAPLPDHPLIRLLRQVTVPWSELADLRKIFEQKWAQTVPRINIEHDPRFESLRLPAALQTLHFRLSYCNSVTITRRGPDWNSDVSVQADDGSRGLAERFLAAAGLGHVEIQFISSERSSIFQAAR